MEPKQKILIVDDSEINRAMLKEILGEGYEYLEANLRVNAPCDIPIDVPDKGDFRFHNNT